MTDQELRDLVESIAKFQAETVRQMAETDRKMAETDRQIKQVNRQLGKLGNKFGSFAEGMALLSMEKILRDRFNMDIVTPRATSRLNGRMIEIEEIGRVPELGRIALARLLAFGRGGGQLGHRTLGCRCSPS